MDFETIEKFFNPQAVITFVNFLISSGFIFLSLKAFKRSKIAKDLNDTMIKNKKDTLSEIQKEYNALKNEVEELKKVINTFNTNLIISTSNTLSESEKIKALLENSQMKPKTKLTNTNDKPLDKIDEIKIIIEEAEKAKKEKEKEIKKTLEAL